MVEKESDETRVIYWYHRRFIEVANKVYVTNLGEVERENVFSNVIDFFNETWKDKPKPFKYNPRIMKKKQIESAQAEANRHTTTQLTEFISEDGLIRYNKRKITELPGFISRLTSNLCIPLACKHIYFNYQFLHGLFACCTYIDILDELKKINSFSSYQMSDESKAGLKELKFLNYLYLQCLLSMSDHPDSLAVQILSRVLIFNGDLPHLTQFIQECDKYSPSHCALVAPYQSLTPPGIGPLFVIEKHTKPVNCTVIGHKSFIFSMSTNIHIFNMQSGKDSGFIELPKTTVPYKQFIVYFSTDNFESSMPCKLINGVTIVISDRSLYSINLDSTTNFTKLFENLIIKKIFQITTSHILVCFENSNFFEIYNFYTGEMIISKNFEKKIKFVETNTQVDKVYLVNNFTDICISVVQQNSEISIFSVVQLSKDKKSNEVRLDLLEKIQPTGIECVNCEALYEKDDYNHEIKPQFCYSLKDGSLMFMVVESRVFSDEVRGLSFLFMKPDIEEHNKNGTNIQLKYLDLNNDVFLLLGNNLKNFFKGKKSVLVISIQTHLKGACDFGLIFFPIY